MCVNCDITGECDQVRVDEFGRELILGPDGGWWSEEDLKPPQNRLGSIPDALPFWEVATKPQVVESVVVEVDWLGVPVKEEE